MGLVCKCQAYARHSACSFQQPIFLLYHGILCTVFFTFLRFYVMSETKISNAKEGKLYQIAGIHSRSASFYASLERMKMLEDMGLIPYNYIRLLRKDEKGKFSVEIYSVPRHPGADRYYVIDRSSYMIGSDLAKKILIKSDSGLESKLRFSKNI